MKAFGNAVLSLFNWCGRTFDLSDIVGLFGLGMVFYGLYQWRPFLAYIVVGSVIFVISALAGAKPKQRIG